MKDVDMIPVAKGLAGVTFTTTTLMISMIDKLEFVLKCGALLSGIAVSIYTIYSISLDVKLKKKRIKDEKAD